MAFIHSYETFGTVDGPGVRFVVFLQGCPLRCKYCHNRDTWEVGKVRIVEEAQDTFKRIERYKHYYILGGGVTITGGEPLLQSEYVASLFGLCKQDELHTALDTSGCILNDAIKEALSLTDLVMLDIKSIDEAQHKELTGVSLVPVVRFLDYLASQNKKVWARHVVIPSITYNDELLYRLALFIKGYPNIEKVDVLPYHTMGAFKWQEMGLAYPLEGVLPLSAEEAKHAKGIFGKAGVKIV